MMAHSELRVRPARRAGVRVGEKSSSSMAATQTLQMRCRHRPLAAAPALLGSLPALFNTTRHLLMLRMSSVLTRKERCGSQIRLNFSG